MMTNTTNKFSHGTFFQWVGLSTLGWIIGVFSAILLIFLYSGTGFNTGVYNFFPPLDSFIGAFLWLPLGFSIGVLQSLQLKQRGIKLPSWIWVTTLGWWVISFYFEGDAFYSPLSGPIVMLIVVSALFGASQALILRSVFLKSGLWVWANVLGICALLFVQFHFLFPPYSYHSTFLDTLFYKSFWESNPPLYSFLSTYTEEISILVLPFIGTLTTAVPTGLLLAKFIGSKSRNEVSSVGSIAG